MQSSSLSSLVLARSRPLHQRTGSQQVQPGEQHQRSNNPVNCFSSPSTTSTLYPGGSFQQQRRKNPNNYPRHRNQTMEAPRRQSRWGDKRQSPPGSNSSPRDGSRGFQRPPYSSEPRLRWGEDVSNGASSNSGLQVPSIENPPGEQNSGAVSCSGIPLKKRKRFFHAHPEEPFRPPRNERSPVGRFSPFNPHGNARTQQQQKEGNVPTFEHKDSHQADICVQNSGILTPIQQDGEDDDEKAAIVSDGPHADSCLETSTASSSSFLGSPVRPSATADIPRQIETPVAAATTSTFTTAAEDLLQEKIPKKKSKQNVCATAKVAVNNNTSSTIQAFPTSLDDFEIPRKKIKIHIPRKVSVETKTSCETLSPLPVEATKNFSKDTTENESPGAFLKGNNIDGVLPEGTGENKAALKAMNTSLAAPTRRKQTDADMEHSETVSAAEVPEQANSAKGKSNVKAKVTAADASHDRLAPPAPRLSAQALRRKKNYLRVQIGARVSVFWDGENVYYDATVTRERPHKKKRFFLEYDDGDREWINLRKERWRLLGGGKSLEESSAEKQNIWTTPTTEIESMTVDDHMKRSVEMDIQAMACDDQPKPRVALEEARRSSCLAKQKPTTEVTSGESVYRKADNKSMISDDVGGTTVAREDDKADSCENVQHSIDVEESAQIHTADNTTKTKPRSSKKKESPSETPAGANLVSTDGVAERASEHSIADHDVVKDMDDDSQGKTPPVSMGQFSADTPAFTLDVNRKASLGSLRSNTTQTTMSSDIHTQTSATEELRAKKLSGVPKKKRKKTRKSRQGFDASDWIYDDDWVSKAAKKTDSDSETDDDEVMSFARQMLGVEKCVAESHKKKETNADLNVEPDWFSDIHIPISEKVKLGRRRSRPETFDVGEVKRVKKKKKRLLEMQTATAAEIESPIPPKARANRNEPKALTAVSSSCPASRSSRPDESEAATATDLDAEKRRIKEEARALTAEEIRAILGENDPCGTSSHWVRRSARMPSRSVINHPWFMQLVHKLKSNDPDMVVLKMKKYLSDPDCPQVCIDTVLDALEENTNCQSLYIQNFNEGMRDKQVLRLLEILKKPSCSIWCLNIGETYKVKTRTWKAFTRGLKETKITHMYASEHTISSELKDKIRKTIRENRKKHNMHIDPNNLDVIVKCTHCWWNPINAKVLRPHLQRKGYAHMLTDGEAQGLRGTQSGATLS